jgi:hypothetical protein
MAALSSPPSHLPLSVHVMQTRPHSGRPWRLLAWLVSISLFTVTLNFYASTPSLALNRKEYAAGLHVILVCYNPAAFKSRWANVRAQQERLDATVGVAAVYTVEIAYDNASFAVTSSNHPNHLQLRWPLGSPPLWSKENLVNIAVRRLLPVNWLACAWIDAEVRFVTNPLWALDAFRALTARAQSSEAADVLQLFRSAVLFGENGTASVPDTFLPGKRRVTPCLGCFRRAPGYAEGANSRRQRL